MEDLKVVTPIYTLKVGGKTFKSQTEGAVIDSMKISTPIDGSKSLDVSICDPYLEVIGSNIYVEDSPISAMISTSDGAINESFDGFISAIDVSFPNTGIPTVSILGIDYSHLLNAKRKSRTWTNTTKVAVMEQIAKEHGLAFECGDGVDKTTIEESIVQDDITDLEFIEELKKDEGEDFRLSFENKKIIFEKINFKGSKNCGTLEYKIGSCNLLSFSPQVNKETKESEVEDKDITASTKQDTSAKTSSSASDSTAQGNPVERNENALGDSAEVAPKVTFDWESQSFNKEG